MSTFLRNKTISKTTPLRKENPFPQFNVASHKRPGIRLSFEYTTTLLSGEGGEGRTGKATMFRKMLSKYTIFSTVFSKIVAPVSNICKAAPISLIWLPNRLNKLPEMVSNFPSNWMVNWQWFFSQANPGMYLNTGAEVGTVNEDFGAVSQMHLTRTLQCSSTYGTGYKGRR